MLTRLKNHIYAYIPDIAYRVYTKNIGVLKLYIFSEVNNIIIITNQIWNGRVIRQISFFFFFFFFFLFFFFFFFFFAYLPSPNLGLTPPGTYKPNACRESNSLLTRTLGRYTRAGLPECVFSTMSGPPPKITGQNTKDTHPILGQKLKFLTPLGIEPGPPVWKVGTLPTTPRRRINFRNIHLKYHNPLWYDTTHIQLAVDFSHTGINKCKRIYFCINPGLISGRL